MDYDKPAKPGEGKDRVRETPVTYDDYAAMPDDGQRYEIDDGVLQAMRPAPSPRHQEVGLEVRRAIEGPPDLCAEVLSTHSLARDKIRKLKAYAKYGVPEYWIVDPIYGSLDQYVLKDSAYELIEDYSGDEPVRSDRLACVNFTMNAIMRWAKDLPN
ncbi:MAG: hypothetical protein K0R75_2446 [Paenibacillaceae bacterium]|nr:hypothetical protein [Paenibacillaceae bacterium]